VREFVDEQKGMRLTIEPEPSGERVTAFPPDNAQDFTQEELYEAIYRLLHRAGLEKEDKK
jgi:hypothetical protein